MAVAGAIGVAAIGGWISDRFSQKRSILLSDVLFTVGTLVMAFAPAPVMIILGRILVGTLVSTNGLLIIGGQFLSYLINLAFTKFRYIGRFDEQHAMFVPNKLDLALDARNRSGSSTLSIDLDAVTSRNKEEEARSILQKIFPANDVNDEMNALKLSVEAEKADEHAIGDNLIQRLKGALSNVVVRRGLYAGITVQVAQQFSGINTVMYYSPTIVQFAGFASNETALTLQLITSDLNVVGSIVSMVFVDRYGRRRIWFKDGCPSKFGFLAIVFLGFYILSYSLGMGTVPWIVNSEIYPLRYRGIGGDLAAVSNWISNLIVSLTFLSLTKALGLAGTFFLFGGVCVIGFSFIYWLVPETKKLPVEEVEKMLESGYKPKLLRAKSKDKTHLFCPK
ncbi:hypothetical protein Goklo_006509 [Gossypium klotzschianum]|uniref:Major facilitator superfamily (MFS) profile domain-containing protein n=2 Tax=Gossypium TaxID=3633 RepID=A0A7J8VHU2_9ROSI|nr:hypothetical protein [Gossypium klotzschianum]